MNERALANIAESSMDKRNIRTEVQQIIASKANNKNVDAMTGNEVILLVHYVGVKKTVEYYRIQNKMAPVDILLELLYQNAGEISVQESKLLQKSYGQDLINDIYDDQQVENPCTLGFFDKAKGWFGRVFNAYNKAEANIKDNGNLRSSGIKADLIKIGKNRSQSLDVVSNIQSDELLKMNGGALSTKMNVTFGEGPQVENDYSNIIPDAINLVADVVESFTSEDNTQIASVDSESEAIQNVGEIFTQEEVEESVVTPKVTIAKEEIPKAVIPKAVEGEKIRDKYVPGKDMLYGKIITMRTPEFTKYKTGITTLHSNDIGIKILDNGVYNLKGANFTVRYDEKNDTSVASMSDADFDFPLGIMRFNIKKMKFSSFDKSFVAENASVQLDLTQFFEFEAEAQTHSIKITDGSFDFSDFFVNLKEFSLFNDAIDVKNAMFFIYGVQKGFKKIISIGYLGIKSPNDSFVFSIDSKSTAGNPDEGWRIEEENGTSAGVKWVPKVDDGSLSLAITDIFKLDAEKITVDENKISAEAIKAKFKIPEILEAEPSVDKFTYTFSDKSVSWENMYLKFDFKSANIDLENIGYINKSFSAGKASLAVKFSFPGGGESTSIETIIEKFLMDKEGLEWGNLLVKMDGFSLFNKSITVESPEFSITGKQDGYKKSISVVGLKSNIDNSVIIDFSSSDEGKWGVKEAGSDSSDGTSWVPDIVDASAVIDICKVLEIDASGINGDQEGFDIGNAKIKLDVAQIDLKSEISASDIVYVTEDKSFGWKDMNASFSFKALTINANGICYDSKAGKKSLQVKKIDAEIELPIKGIEKLNVGSDGFEMTSEGPDWESVHVSIGKFSLFEGLFAGESGEFTMAGSADGYQKSISADRFDMAIGDNITVILGSNEGHWGLKESECTKDKSLKWGPDIVKGSADINIYDVLKINAEGIDSDKDKLTIAKAKASVVVPSIGVDSSLDILGMSLEYATKKFEWDNLDLSLSFKGVDVSVKGINYTGGSEKVLTAKEADVSVMVPISEIGKITGKVSNFKIDKTGANWELLTVGVPKFSFFNNIFSGENASFSMYGKGEGYRKRIHTDKISLNITDVFDASISTEDGKKGWNVENDTASGWQANVEGGIIDLNSKIFSIHADCIESSSKVEGSSDPFKIGSAEGTLRVLGDGGIKVGAEGIEIDKSGLNFSKIEGGIESEFNLFEGFKLKNPYFSLTKNPQFKSAEVDSNFKYYVNVSAGFDANIQNIVSLSADKVSFTMQGSAVESFEIDKAHLSVKDGFIDGNIDKITIKNRGSEKGFRAENLSIMINKAPADSEGMESISNVLGYISKDVQLGISEISYINGKLSYGNFTFTKEKFVFGGKSCGITVDFKQNLVEGRVMFKFPKGIESLGNSGVDNSKAKESQTKTDVAKNALGILPDEKIKPEDYGAQKIIAHKIFGLGFSTPVYPGLNIYGGLDFGAGLAIYGSASAQKLEKKEGEGKNSYKLAGNIGFSGNVWAEAGIGLNLGLSGIATVGAELAAKLGLDVMSGAKVDFVITKENEKIEVEDGAKATYGISADLVFELAFAVKAKFLIFEKTLFTKKLGSWEIGKMEFAGDAVRKDGKFTVENAVKNISIGKKPLNQLKGESLGKMSTEDLENKTIEIKSKREEAERLLLNLDGDSKVIYGGGGVRQELAARVDEIIKEYSKALEMAKTRAEQIEYGLKKSCDDLDKSGIKGHLEKRRVRIGYLKTRYAEFDKLKSQKESKELSEKTNVEYKRGINKEVNRLMIGIMRSYVLVEMTDKNKYEKSSVIYKYFDELSKRLSKTNRIEKDQDSVIAEFVDSDIKEFKRLGIYRCFVESKIYKDNKENLKNAVKYSSGGSRFYSHKELSGMYSIKYGDEFTYNKDAFEAAYAYEKGKQIKAGEEAAQFLLSKKYSIVLKQDEATTKYKERQNKSKTYDDKLYAEYESERDKQTTLDYINATKEYKQRYTDDNYFASSKGYKENVGALLRFEEARQFYYELKEDQITDPIKKLEEHKIAIIREIDEINAVLTPLKEASGGANNVKLEKGDETLLNAIRKGSKAIRDKRAEEETREIGKDQTEYLTKRIKK